MLLQRILAWTLIVGAVATSVTGLLLLAVWPLGAFLDFGWPLQTVLVWDTALSLLFFVQHSVMVRRKVRAAMRIPDHSQGAVYALASGVTLSVVMLLWQGSDAMVISVQGPWRIAAYAISLGALAFFVWGVVALRGFDPCGIGAVRAHLKGRRPPVLPFAVRGPYRWVRHPLYTAVIVLFWCNPDVTLDRLWFNVLWTAWIWVGLHLEENDLVREFGAPYKQYQRHVPALIPWRGPVSLPEPAHRHHT